MKKLILAAAAVFAFGVANAQDMKLGIKAGLNVATISGTTDAKSLYGANVGVFGEFKVSDKFSVQPELLFSMQGAKSSESKDFGGGFYLNTTNKLTLNYINIPIMAKFFVADKFSLQAGPQIGFLMTANSTEEKSSNVPGYVNNSSSTDVKSSYNSVDFGVNFGAGYSFTENIAIDLRYNLGLNGLDKNLASGSTATYNRVFSLNFGYSF